MNKTILVIGGGKWQTPIVQKAKSMGFVVVCTNLYENSPAFAYADFSYVVDILDKEKNLQLAQTHSVSAVVSDQTDIAVKTVAYINEKLGLRGVGLKNAGLFTDKLAMRKTLQVKGLHHPRYKVCKTADDIKEFYEELHSPIILKPVSNQSSRGIRYVDSIEDIQEAFLYTLSFSKESYFLAEEYIGGVELTAEGYKPLNTKHKTLAISQKKYFEKQIGVASELLYMPDSQLCSYDVLKSINNALFENIPFAITHVEYKYYRGKFYLIEAALRGGGTKISSLIIPKVSGNDVNAFLLYNAIGEDKIEEASSRVSKKYAVLKFFSFKEGIVKKIEGVEKIHRHPDIIDFELEFNVGDKILSPVDDRSRVGYFIAVTQSYEELRDLMSYVDESLQVYYEES